MGFGMKKIIGFTVIMMVLAVSGYAQNNSSQDLIGTWTFSGGSVEFNADQTGTMALKNQNSSAPCPEGSVTKFKWDTSDNRLSLEYTSMHICGERQPTPESDDPQSFSIQGSTLSWANINWEREY